MVQLEVEKRIDTLFVTVQESDEVRAAKLILNRGRFYYVGEKRVALLQVFSTNREDLAVLKRVFGGAYYVHSSGWQWSVSSKSVLTQVADTIFPLKDTRPDRAEMLNDIFAFRSPVGREN